MSLIICPLLHNTNLIIQSYLILLAMYREEIYIRRLQAELKSIMQTQSRGCLTISQNNNPFYYPAHVILGFSRNLATELQNKPKKTVQEYIYLIVSLKMTNQNYLNVLATCRKTYPNINFSENAQRLVEYFTKADSVPEPTQAKQSLRRKYEKLLGKAEAEGYFRIPEVPVFLISTHWLQKFYSSDVEHPGPVNNQMLLEASDFPLAENKYSHFNYRVRADVRENQDFKVLPFEAWKLIEQNYGGVEVRRFTTREKVPTVEIWYVETRIWVVEERAVLMKLNILVSKNETIQQVLQRLRLTLKKYQGVPEGYLARQPVVYKVNGLEPDEFTALLHNEQQSHLLAQKMERIKNLSIQFEEASIFSNRQALVINYGKAFPSVFEKVPLLKVIQFKQKCLRCGNTDGLEICKCRSVYFCSKTCKASHKEHEKECSSIQSEARKYTIVTEYFQVKKRSYPQLGSLLSLGKVGFQNLGNTCYMNAALQCVLRIEPIVRYFLNNQHLSDLNVGNVLGSEGYLACAFGQLVKSYYTTNRRALQPAAVLRVIAKNPQFRGYNHQDSQQFLNYFLDKLHEDLNRIKAKPYTQQVQSKGRADDIVSKESWENYLKRNDSVIVDSLAGQYRSEIRCPDCKKLSITFDPFLSLTLQFPRPEKGLQINGWFMTEDGQFQKVAIEVRSSMPTHEFYSKFFETPVYGTYQKDKLISNIWDPNATVFNNQKQKGVLFFYEKPLGNAVEVRFQINNPGQNFVRIAFANAVEGQNQLIKMFSLAIRKPLEKALGKDLNTENFLTLCREPGFIRIQSVSRQPKANPLYPITGAAIVTVKVRLDTSKLKLTSQLKLNSGSKKYQGKVDCLVRKVANQISMPQLLQCFSEPERLTQENAWYCNICKDHKLADKAMELFKAPKFLIVHLKRFNHRGDSGNRYIIYGEKVSTPILLSEFQTIRGRRYQLIGVVNHVGSLMHGHYTAIAKRDEWYNYDDSRCGRTTLDGKNAYLLFYQAVQ